MSGKRRYPQWFDGHKVNEILFCEEFRKEHWLSQSMYFFSKESIASLFRKTEGTVHDRDIAARNWREFACAWKLHESANPLHQITN